MNKGLIQAFDMKNQFLIGAMVGVFFTGCKSIEVQCAKSSTEYWQPAISERKTDIQVPTNLKSKTAPYSLIDLIEIGLDSNPTAKESWWLAKTAEANKGRAESSFYPTITVGATVEKAQVGETKNQPMQLSEGFGPSVEITYKLFQFGADKANAESARHALYAANFQFNRKLQELVFKVQQNYYQLCAAYASVEAREANLKDAETSYRAVSKRKEAGLAKTQDWLRAQAENLQAAYELAEAKATLEQCRAELAKVVGLRISSEFKIETHFEPPAETSVSSEIESLLEKTLNTRPDLLSAQADLVAKEWQQKSEERKSWPQLTFGLTSGTKKWSSTHNWQRNYSGQVALKWDIFDGFDREYRNLEAYSQKKATEAVLKQKTLDVLGDTWSAFYAFKCSNERLVSASALKKASFEALEAIRIGYDSGINSLLDLLSAQKNLAEARLSHVQAKADVALSLIELAYATGQLELKEISPKI